MITDILKIDVGYNADGALAAIGNVKEVVTNDGSDTFKVKINTAGWVFDPTRQLDTSPNGQYHDFRNLHGVWIYDPDSNFSYVKGATQTMTLSNLRDDDIPTHKFCVCMKNSDGMSLMFDPYVRDKSIGVD